jgi:hypothetical protein
VFHIQQVLRQDQQKASQNDAEVEAFFASYERFKAGDGRDFGKYAYEEDYGDEYVVHSVTLH